MFAAQPYAPAFADHGVDIDIAIARTALQQDQIPASTASRKIVTVAILVLEMGLHQQADFADGAPRFQGGEIDLYRVPAGTAMPYLPKSRGTAMGLVLLLSLALASACTRAQSPGQTRRCEGKGGSV